ncbi:MAG: ammonium transporter, partial [Verrucomicrobiota bacterium]
ELSNRDLTVEIIALNRRLNDNSAKSEEIQLNLNHLLIVMAAALVFIMQAGFCMVEMGFSQAKNAINIAMKNILDFSVATTAYLFVGFALMFGHSAGGWFGQDAFWLSRYPADSELWSFWLFQSVFVATAATIASGAMAERTKFLGYLVYTLLLSAFLYPIFGHWAWGSSAAAFAEDFGGSAGWLEGLGFHDFAGSAVVHGIGGAAALAGIMILGPRKGRFTRDGTPRLIPGHNIPLASLGTLLLWFGWFGFNAGSSLTAGADLGRICVNTSIAASIGVLVAMGTFWKIEGRPDVGIALNGALAGLVSITAGADVVTPASAVLIGGIGGILASVGFFFLQKCRLDDVVGAVPVHLFGGVWGTLCVGIFHEDLAMFSGVWFKQILVQGLGVIMLVGGAFIAAYGIFKIIDHTVGLRASDEEQEEGLDFAEHSSNAYPDFQTH